jgi:serine O-acetyltransferase
LTPPRTTWKETCHRLADDEARIREMLRARFGTQPHLLLFEASWRCVLLHRLAHFFWGRGARKSARLFMQLNSLVTGADIHPACNFGGGLLIPHPAALTASGNAGRNLTMMPLSGIGMLPREEDVGAGPGLPLLGDDVWLGAGCGVLGPVRVGDGARLQPGASLTRHVAPRSVVEMAARPAEQIEVRPAGPRLPPSGAHTCDHAAWSATRRDIDRDIIRYLTMREPALARSPGALRKLSAALSTEVMGVALYRLSHFLECAGWRRLARFACAANVFLLRLTIAPACCLGGGLFLPHPAGAVINATAGRDLTMYARSFCTSLSPARTAETREGPVIGDRVVIAGMAAALGPIAVGDDTHIGFNVQLREDAPGACSVASVVMATRVAPLEAPNGEGGAPLPAPAVGRLTLAETRARLREDRERLAAIYHGKPPWVARTCVHLFRLSRHFMGAKRVGLARWCWRLNARLTGADIDPRCDIGGGLAIPHPAGISIHATAGRNLTVLALAGIGGAVAGDPFTWDMRTTPTLGDDVEVCEHAALHGRIRVGSRARIGPGCKVREDVAQGVALEVPAPKMRRGARPPPGDGASAP